MPEQDQELTQREQELAQQVASAKDDLRRFDRQLTMVIDLNKCIGCQTCTMACKSLWTQKEGREYMWWNTVNTMPGKGTPKNWEKEGGGGYKLRFGGKVREPVLGKLPTRKEFGDEWKFNFDEIVNSEQGTVHLQAKNPDGTDPDWAMNWDEDQGGGKYPNAFYFYIPRLCNHCAYPACLDACPRNAIYKREEDGSVQIDQKRCKGYRFCIEACPYKKIYFNFAVKKSQKCIFCYPRVEKGVANACVRQCTGRARWIGFVDDEDGSVHKLVKKWKVALPLHPEYGTEPNVFYVPPMSPKGLDKNYEVDDNQERIPMDYLRYLFGPEVDQSLDTLNQELGRVREGGKSELMEVLIAKRWSEILGPLGTDPVTIEQVKIKPKEA